MSEDYADPMRVIAALRGRSNETVVHLGITCDGCGEEMDGDFLVAADADRAERYEAVFVFAENQGWRVHRRVNEAHCPDCLEGE